MDHQYYMQRALELAAKGWPRVAPNPMVGCVIVCGDRVVASGFHEQFGQPHAEVNAVQSMPADLAAAGCTVYVTLEPCSHHGKTPPCTDLLIQKGFRKVIVACRDPNPLVSGAGIGKLLEAGMDVQCGILEKEARDLNRRFMTFFEKKRPYIVLKWALTADGFISRAAPAERKDNIITREPAHRLVHRLRAENIAILAGKNTVLADDPVLTTRLVEGRNPVRLVIDGRLEIPESRRVYNEDAPTIVFNFLREGQNGHISYIKVDRENVTTQILEKLYALKVQSLLVEGGAAVLQDFIDKDLWDEALVFQNPDLRFGSGKKGPVFPLKNTFELIGEDKLFRHRRTEAMEGGRVNEVF